MASRDLPITDTRALIGKAHWRTDSLCMALEMVEAGLGWGDFPLSRVAPLLEAGRLLRLDFKNTRNELQLPVHAFWRHTQPLQKAARELVSLLGV
ncbi:LysR substrate binding domain protein [compost metagenome]